MKDFETAKMDDLTRIITVAVVLLVLAIPFFPGGDEMDLPVRILILALGTGVAVFSYLHVPQNFSVSNKSLSFKNALRSHEILLDDIKSVSKAKNKIQFRVFGIGGLFGYFGRYNGTEKWLVTNRHKKVKLETEAGIFVISPEEPDDFIAYINRLKN